jgi:hypothetical protein
VVGVHLRLVGDCLAAMLAVLEDDVINQWTYSIAVINQCAYSISVISQCTYSIAVISLYT